MEIYVYADWIHLNGCQLIGTLYAEAAKGRKAFRFEYDQAWLKSGNNYFVLDPDLEFFSGSLYPNNNKENFGIFLDSMPDRWGRRLMQRNENLTAKAEDRQPRKLYEIDFLLGVYDAGRMGALRFKLDKEGIFVNDGSLIPAWTSIKDLQLSAGLIESDTVDEDVLEHIRLLLAPGTSLGGARPKANVLDDDGHPWIAKFPSKSDTHINKGAWEYLAYQLATQVGIEMASCKIEKIIGKHHTFFTKRFDRIGQQRIHFTSAMTMIGLDENTLKDKDPSYLDIVDAIESYSCAPTEDLKQLWLRIVFHICISNTDDHLRNHGFILKEKGWRLSPAFDINPSIKRDHLALYINQDNSLLDLSIAVEVGGYFRMSEQEMNDTINHVFSVVKSWRKVATQIGISNKEQDFMAAAFRTEF